MVKVKRIVANLATQEPTKLAAFYSTLFDLDVAMDMGWIVTMAASTDAPVHLSLVAEGGGGAPVPDVSIEVDDLDTVHARAVQSGAEVVYPLTDEPWGLRRFFVVDPAGHVLNVLQHN